MPVDDTNRESRSLPEGFAAVPLSAAGDGGFPRLCVLFKRTDDAEEGRFVVLRNTVDARVLLGAMLDAGGLVAQWVEVWIQNLAGLAKTVPASREALSNKVLDDRWRRHLDALLAVDPARVLQTGWETAHPLPALIDPAGPAPVQPCDKSSGERWALCQDDPLLVANGLPPYSTSAHRYLHLPGKKGGSPFLPVTTDAPTNEHTQPLAGLTAGGLVPLNIEGGLILVTVLSTLGYEAFQDVLNGETWQGVRHARSFFVPDRGLAWLAAGKGTAASTGRLFLGAHGLLGRLIETLHLKLCLLADAAAAVQAAVEKLQRPMFNLSPDSFRVHVSGSARSLPFLWTAKAVLVDPGNAASLPIKTGEAEYYTQAVPQGASIYWPASLALPVRGRCSIRIRKTLADAQGGGVALEGTFSAQERIRTARNDLVWLRLDLGEAATDFYARLEEETALASGEWRFRTLGQKLSRGQTAALRSAEGVPLTDILFELVPVLSSPCDLYSLGVLAARTLLVDKVNALPVALDELLSLARQLAVSYDANATPRSRIGAIFQADKRWVQTLGPQHLMHEELSSEQAFDLVPAELWWDVLEMMVRLFPGVGPDSTCKDYGDARPGGIHRVFDRLIEDLDSLILRTRSLIVIDWRFNREIHAVIRSCLTGMEKA